jgi:nicotinamide mononucleotide transporter
MNISQFFNVNTVFFTVLGYPMSYLEFFGTIFNLWCVWLAAKNKISNWAVGLVGIILYVFLFYQIQLYSDLIEQFYFFVMTFYGWYLWVQIGKEEKAKPKEASGIRFTTLKEKIVYIVVLVIGTGLLTIFTSHLTDLFPNLFPIPASYPFWDAFTTVMSFAATVLLAKKVVENWYLWILVDVIGIWLYFIKGVKFISLEYVIFLMMASYGLFDWIRTLNREGKIKMPWLKV